MHINKIHDTIMDNFCAYSHRNCALSIICLLYLMDCVFNEAFPRTVDTDPSETPMSHDSACMEAYEYVLWLVLFQQFLEMLQ